MHQRELPTETDPTAILNFWIAMEALNPQKYKKRTLDVPFETRGRAKVPRHTPIELDLGREVKLPWQQEEHRPEHLGLRPAGEKNGETLRWQLPLGFIDLGKAGAILSERFDALGLDDTEREREPAEGWALLALAELDASGILIEGSISISSFGWACGRALAGKRDELHTFPDRERSISESVRDSLVTQDSQGFQVSTSRDAILRAMRVLRDAFEIEPFIKELGVKRATHVIRNVVSTDGSSVPSASDGDIINSFHLRELADAKKLLPSLRNDSPLVQYLGRAKRNAQPVDPLASYEALEQLSRPEAVPLGRWPSPEPVRLVTLQQAAVNAVSRTLQDRGLFAINGPPGTGKTTLLRDLVADVVVRRAERLSELDRPEHAFELAGKTGSLGNYRFKIHRLKEELRGQGIVVASENNEAVRNISRELPTSRSIRAQPEVNARPFVEYFKDLADALNSKQENWGLCAAELGNASNCRSFVDRVWFNRSEDGGGDGLMYYLKDMFDAGEGVTSRNDAPKTRTAALSAWRRARRSFHEAVAVAQKHQADKAAAREIVAQGAELEDRARTAQLALREAQLEIETLSGEAAHLEAMLERTRARHGDCDNEVSDLKTERKSSLRWCIFPTKEWKEAFADSTAAKRSARREQDRLEQEQEELHQRLARARLRREVAEAKAREVERLKKLYQDACAHLDTLGLRRHADPEFWSDTNEAIQTASPWSDEASRQARDDVFRAAVHLHKAFIDAAPYPIRHNLSLLMDHIRGRTLASDLIEYLGDLWDTFFLVVPLYSTTFASAGRMLRKMPPDSIGWLLIDEAGQAAPQSAAGALLRARRAVVMGDPLQIEPVVTLPEGIRRSLAHSYGLRADDWSGEVASCQVLADRAAKYQSFVDGRRVGFPLLVHRRCEEPMFSLANHVAYGGLMVHAAVAKPSPLVDALPPRLQSSCWLHVEARAKKWSAEEGHAASEILTRLLTSGLGDPSIYFISPFREVALQLREVLRPIAGKDWVKHHVGTIHTFQGKEADIVCLVLGASAESSQGSRSWAGRSPNILNVAVTRAKRLLIIIGHQDAWKHAGVFRLAVSPQRLPRVEYSPSLFVEPVVPSPAQGPKRVSQDGSPPAAGSS